MNDNRPSRAAKIAQEIGQKMQTLAEQGKVAPILPIKGASQEKDTPEMRKKRRIALDKLRTFLD